MRRATRRNNLPAVIETRTTPTAITPFMALPPSRSEKKYLERMKDMLDRQNGVLKSQTDQVEEQHKLIIAQNKLQNVYRDIEDEEIRLNYAWEKIEQDRILEKTKAEVELKKLAVEMVKAITALNSAKEKSVEDEDDKVAREVKKTKKMAAINKELRQLQLEEAIDAAETQFEAKQGLVAKYGEEKGEEISDLLAKILNNLNEEE